MQTDLLITKEEELYLWAKQKVFVSKADLMRYGCDKFYLRAWRTVCDWVGEGRARKIPSEECIFRNLTGKMAYYEIL